MRAVFLCLILCVQLVAETSSLVDSGNQFSFKLFETLEKEENTALCPFSVQSSLYMTYLGSRGLTELEMKKALYLRVSQQHLPQEYRHLWTNLFFNPKAKDRSPFLTANSLWVAEKYQVLPVFSFIIQKNLFASVEQTSFDPPETGINAINDFVQAKTKGHIKDLVSDQEITPSTRMALINATYLKANWEKPFSKKMTHLAPFYIRDDVHNQVSMMHQIETLLYADTSRFESVALLFRQVHPKNLAFIAALPKEGAKLDQTDVSEILTGLAEKKVDLFLPTFLFEKRYNLNNQLMQMGMIKPFSTQADFSGVSGKKDLFLSDVVHCCYFSLGETGVEAAGATSASLNLKSTGGQSEITLFRADRPFYYLIVDLDSGLVFFIGKFDKPEPIPVKKSFFSLG